MSQFGLLKLIVTFLERENIPYMLVGSFVSSLYGEPRSTHDIDIIVSLTETSIDPLVKEFLPPRYYIASEAIQLAIQSKRSFNLIDTEEGDKIDFFILKNDEYEEIKFKRKRREEIMGIPVNVLSPEDLILSKFIWSVLSGGSEKQYKDALGVLRVQFKHIDFNYLESQAKVLNVNHLLQRALRDLSETDFI